jgi:hypothetical protein
MPPEVAAVEFAILPSGAVVTFSPGANTAAFRAALLDWCAENGAAPAGKIDAWRLGSLLAKVPR